ncbi:MAG: glycerophosphodiester phosphodiesterase [Solirubrobacteraceae bacterium]
MPRQNDDVHVPPLAEVLDQIAGRAAIQLDLREPGCERDALRISHACVTPERLLVTSFLPNAIQTIRALDPRIATGLIVSGRPRNWRPLAPIDALLPFRAVRACRADVLIAHQALDLVAVRPRAARAGVPLILWTVNDRRRLASALADDRLLGVVTDRLPQGSIHPGAPGARA